jgi:hypothetical protein
MSASGGPDLVTDRLVLCLDAADKQSYIGSGTTWRDLTPNNNTCALQNSPTFVNEFQGSINFASASNQYGIVSPSSSIIPSSSMTWQIAVKFNTFPTYGPIFKKGEETDSTGHIALFHTNNNLRLQASDVLYSTRFVDSAGNWSTTLSTGIFYIFHLTYDGSNFRMYYNGVLRHTTAWAFGLGNNNQQLWLSRFWAGYLNGNMAHFSIFNRVLTANEIYQNNKILKRRFRL